MEFKHTSVLLKETIDGLAIKQNGIYVDGTLGGGGHASELCSRLSPEAVFIGIDRDRDALEAAGKRLEKYPCRKHFVQSNYSDIKDVLNELEIEQVDGAMLDLGNTLLEVFADGAGLPDKGRFAHIALCTDDVDGMIEQMRALGRPILVEPKDAVLGGDYPIRVGFCQGPAGEEVEFFCER